MPEKRKKRTITLLLLILTMLLLMVFQGGAYAEGEDAGGGEPAGASEPSEELPAPQVTTTTEEPAGEAETGESGDGELTVEEQTVPDETADGECENLSQVVEAISEANVMLADQEGNPIALASEQAAALLAAPDPYIVRGGVTHRFLTDCTGQPVDATNTCTETPTPVQSAINFAVSGETVFIENGVYPETVSINKAITLNGGGSAFVDVFNLYAGANVAGSSGVFATIVNVFGGAKIQDGVTLVAVDGTVNVGPGVFFENIAINKPMELAGAGQAETTIHPASSGANPGGAGSIPAGSSNVILVQAHDVTIRDLTIDGDNPTLTSGIVRGGADLDARNGIITDHRLGTFNNLEVYNTTVRNIYLRGIYASSYGTFNFHHNTVDNVQGEYASIAMMNFGGSGIFAYNTISNASDGIASNWSTGTQYLNNHVYNVGSGIHSDNNRTNGDLIQGNIVENADWGIFTFAPYVGITVENNMVVNSGVGLAASGSQTVDGATTFSGNFVDGQNRADSIGAYITTDIWGYGYRNVRAFFQNNIFQNLDVGFYYENEDTPYSGAFDGSTSISSAVNHNDILNIQSILVDNSHDFHAGTIDATNNWWGGCLGPDPDKFLGSVEYIPWTLKARCLASPAPAVPEPIITLPAVTLPTATAALIPVTGGQLMTLSCEQANTLSLPNGNMVIFDRILCDYRAILDVEVSATLPSPIPDGLVFADGMTLVLLKGGTALRELDLGSLALYFVVPEGMQGADFTVLHWDAEAGEWVELAPVSMADWMVSAATDLTGTFVLAVK